jgi:uroporphyrinogen decarboxylase
MNALDDLTPRQLWQNIMHYRSGEFDRMPVIHWTCWEDTILRWKEEGLPQHIERLQGEHSFFNAHYQWSTISCHLGPYPLFDTIIEEETDEYTLFWDGQGVLTKDFKHAESVPHYMDWTFKTADDWPRFKERLQIYPERVPKRLHEQIERAEGSGLPIVIFAGSMMGWVRDWMGVENMVYLMYDSPDCYADIVDTLSDLVCWSIDQIVARMSSKVDMAHGWEDIAGSTGPFVSPDVFDRIVAPGYKKIRAKLDEHGIDIYSIDSDGKVEPLIANWMAAGVNMQFPLEPGTWDCRPEAMRAKFGKELLIQGGFNKLVLERGRDAIDEEIERHIPLMKEGGFVMMPDHLITPGVPLDDYKYYLERIRELRF